MNPHPGEPTTKGKTPRQGRGTALLKVPAQPSLPGGCSSPPAPHLQAQCTRDPGSGARATPQPVSTVPEPFSWWNHSPASPRGEQTEMVLHAQRSPASPEQGHGEEGATTEVRALVPCSRHGRRCRGLPAAVLGLYKRQAAPSALLHQGCWVRPPPPLPWVLGAAALPELMEKSMSSSRARRAARAAPKPTPKPTAFPGCLAGGAMPPARSPGLVWGGGCPPGCPLSAPASPHPDPKRLSLRGSQRGAELPSNRRVIN